MKPVDIIKRKQGHDVHVYPTHSVTIFKPYEDEDYFEYYLLNSQDRMICRLEYKQALYLIKALDNPVGVASSKPVVRKEVV